MIVLIDNYDSFTYNLVQLLGAMQERILVRRNDKLTLEEIDTLRPTHIVLSPGPGKPAQAGICEAVVRFFAPKIPILGVCLGHQAICEVYGGTVTYARELMHGKASEITLDTACPIFAGLPKVIHAGRYHSLAMLPETAPAILKVSAVTQTGEVMAVAHTLYPVFGVQFHPESVLTPDGPQILKNFLQI